MTEDPITHVTNDELRKAEANWIEWHRGVMCQEVYERYFNFLHSKEQGYVDDLLIPESKSERYHVCASTAEKVKMLAGPHYNAIITAYFVKNPWHKK